MELKPKSFRITDSTSEKFREISSDIGGNQEETMAKLIETYEFQSSKNLIPNKREDIEKFEKYVNVLTRLYMVSLEDNQNISEAVRADFEAMLISKDKVIADLQGQLTAAVQIKEEAAMKSRAFKEEAERLNTEIIRQEQDLSSRIEDLQEMLTTKDNLNKALSDSCHELKKKADSMEQECEQASAIQKELLEARMELDRLTQAEADLKSKLQQALSSYDILANESKQHEKDSLESQKEKIEIAYQKEILDLKRTNQEKVQEIKARVQEEIDKYQQKYLELLERLGEINPGMNRPEKSYSDD